MTLEEKLLRTISKHYRNNPNIPVKEREHLACKALNNASVSLRLGVKKFWWRKDK